MLSAAAAGREALAALLAELYATPKPGLVDNRNSGAHTDMDAHTFERSAAAVAPYIARLYQAGADSAAIPPNAALPVLRQIGREAEAAMLNATSGVNTHKGAIFSMGLLAAAAGRLTALGQPLYGNAVCLTAGEYVSGICRAELVNAKGGTHGEQMYRRYGTGGVRQEAESGFYHLRTIALPCLAKYREAGLAENEALLLVLLRLIAAVPDTNVLARAGDTAMAYARREAEAALREVGEPVNVHTLLARMAELDADFTQRNISPGGCADLLACAVFVAALCE